MWAPGRGRRRVMARGGELRAYNEGLPHVGAYARGDVPEPPAPVYGGLGARGPRRVPGPKGGGRPTRRRPRGPSGTPTRPRGQSARAPRRMRTRPAPRTCAAPPSHAGRAPGRRRGAPRDALPVHGDEWPQAGHQMLRGAADPNRRSAATAPGAAGARGRLCPMPPPRTRRPGPPARGPCSRLRTRAWNSPPSSVHASARRGSSFRRQDAIQLPMGVGVLAPGRQARGRDGQLPYCTRAAYLAADLTAHRYGTDPPPRPGRRRPPRSRAAVACGAADATQLATFSGYVSTGLTVRAARVLHSALTAAPSVLP